MAITGAHGGAERPGLMSSDRRPLFEIWPQLEPELGFQPLGDFPTPIEPLARLVPELGSAAGESYVKRDDQSSPVYGGNKVRTLEPLLGHARRQGRRSVLATGAYGSNHAVATVLHAERAGFRSGVMLFPQPFSETAMANLRVSITHADSVTDVLHWSTLPLAIWRARRQASPGRDALIMPPGGAIPRGCLGFMSAGLELGMQIERGLLPPPAEIILALGSTCSTAGLLVGLRLAVRLGLGFKGGAAGSAPPLLVAVRVTPWPVTSAFRILNLARRLSTWLLELSRDPLFDIERAELGRGLEVDGAHLGAGYGRPSAAGLAAIERLRPFSAALDTTYSAKSAAALLHRISLAKPCTRLFWSTKSLVPLPVVPLANLRQAPPRMRRWLERGALAVPEHY